MKESCIGCARRVNGKCTMMYTLPSQRQCFVTLDQAIQVEIDIINYIDAGKYPHDFTQDRRQRTMAINKLKKLKSMKGA